MHTYKAEGERIRTITDAEDTRIRTLTDAEAVALGLASEQAAALSVDTLTALIGTDLAEAIAKRTGSKLHAHVQMIAARVAIEQGLDPIQCLNDLDKVLERMGTDKPFGEQVKALGKRMGAPQPAPAPNRHERRAAKARARARTDRRAANSTAANARLSASDLRKRLRFVQGRFKVRYAK